MGSIKFGSGKLNIEYIFLFIAAAVLLYIGPGTILGHKIVHDYPYGYFASDAFGEIAFAEWFNSHGKNDLLPPYMRFGYNDTAAFHMPSFYSINAIHSNLTGIEIYDSVVLPYLFSILAVFIMYLVARSFNLHVGIIGLSSAVFLFMQKFVISLLWGNWDFALAIAYLAAAFWFIGRKDLKGHHVYLGIFIAAITLTHIAETIFLVLFFVFYFIFKLVKKEMEKGEAIHLVIAGAIGFVLSLRYLIVFYHGYWKGSGYSLSHVEPGNFDVLLSQFSFGYWLIIVGIIAALYFAWKANHYAAIPAIFALVIGYGNFFGFDNRAFQFRYAWPIFLGFYIGVGIYFILKLIVKEIKIVYSTILSLLLMLAFANAAGYKDATNPGMMDPHHWQMIRWISANTENSAKILYFYGDIYSQDAVLWPSRRQSYVIEPQQFIDLLKNRTVTQEYYIEFIGASDAFIYRKNFFDYGFRRVTDLKAQRNICQFDYLVFDKGASVPVLAQYNMFIANRMAKNEWIKPVFANELIIILRNEKTGADCIEEGQIP